MQYCLFFVTLPVFSCSLSQGVSSSGVHVTREDSTLLPFYSCLKLRNSFHRSTEIIAVRLEELHFSLPTPVRLIRCVTVLLRPAVQGLGCVIWTRIKAEEHCGSTCHCMCSVSSRDGNEFWEISFLKIVRVHGSHLLGNSSLYYETIMCCDYISDKGNQRCCQTVTTEVFQHRRLSLCSSWLGWGQVSWLGHCDDFSCAVGYWRMGGEDWGMSSAALGCVCAEVVGCHILVSQVQLGSSSLLRQSWRSSVFITLSTPAGFVN